MLHSAVYCHSMLCCHVPECHRVGVKLMALPQRECCRIQLENLSHYFVTWYTHCLSSPGHKPHVLAGLTEQVSPSNNHNQLAPPKESLPRQLSGKHTLQQDASPSQLPGPSSAKQETSQEPVSKNQQQQQQPEGLSVPKAAVHSRPERPTSARRGPPKIPQTGSAGKYALCQPHAHEAGFL